MNVSPLSCTAGWFSYTDYKKVSIKEEIMGDQIPPPRSFGTREGDVSLLVYSLAHLRVFHGARTLNLTKRVSGDYH